MLPPTRWCHRPPVRGRLICSSFAFDSSSEAAGSPSDTDMIDSAAFLVRSSAVGQRWAYVLRVVVAFAWPSDRCTVTTSHPAAMRPEA